jgi:hypothetical protein
VGACFENGKGNGGGMNALVHPAVGSSPARGRSSCCPHSRPLTGWIPAGPPKRKHALCGNIRRKPPITVTGKSCGGPWGRQRGVQRRVNGPSSSSQENTKLVQTVLGQGSKLSLARAHPAAHQQLKTRRAHKGCSRGQCTTGDSLSPQQWRYLSCKYRHVLCRLNKRTASLHFTVSSWQLCFQVTCGARH